MGSGLGGQGQVGFGGVRNRSGVRVGVVGWGESGGWEKGEAE